MKKYLVIFGGEDLEEGAARVVAMEAGCVLATATVAGVKVHAGNAYVADGFTVGDDEGDLSTVTGVACFECSPSMGDVVGVTKCDHHNPGDPGFGLGADQYWEASSLGQLCALLGAERTHELELVAASDHCPADAYAGRCPGVAPSEFLGFRVARLEKFYSGPLESDRTPGEIRADIESAKKKLSTAQSVEGIRDFVVAGDGTGESPELEEAALATQEAYMISFFERDENGAPTGNSSIILRGHTPPEVVRRFREWGNSLPNRVEAYAGRGFAEVVVRG